MKFKFRAWDKESKYMRDWENLNTQIYNPSWYRDNTDKDIDNNMFSDPDLILMQYTGLKDKQGKEIYSGDYIVSIDEDITYTGEVVWSEMCPGFYVKWEKVIQIDGEDVCCPEFECLCDVVHDTTEIIGNKFQHPELLK